MVLSLIFGPKTQVYFSPLLGHSSYITHVVLPNAHKNIPNVKLHFNIQSTIVFGLFEPSRNQVSSNSGYHSSTLVLSQVHNFVSGNFYPFCTDRSANTSTLAGSPGYYLRCCCRERNLRWYWP